MISLETLKSPFGLGRTPFVLFEPFSIVTESTETFPLTPSRSFFIHDSCPSVLVDVPQHSPYWSLNGLHTSMIFFLNPPTLSVYSYWFSLSQRKVSGTFGFYSSKESVLENYRRRRGFNSRFKVNYDFCNLTTDVKKENSPESLQEIPSCLIRLTSLRNRGDKNLIYL